VSGKVISQHHTVV